MTRKLSKYARQHGNKPAREAEAKAVPAEPVFTAGERAAFEADEARRELGSLLMSMAIIRELTKTQQCHADETVAAVRAALAATPAAPAPLTVTNEMHRAAMAYAASVPWSVPSHVVEGMLRAAIAASKGEKP